MRAQSCRRSVYHNVGFLSDNVNVPIVIKITPGRVADFQKTAVLLRPEKLEQD